VQLPAGNISRELAHGKLRFHHGHPAHGRPAPTLSRSLSHNAVRLTQMPADLTAVAEEYSTNGARPLTYPLVHAQEMATKVALMSEAPSASTAMPNGIHIRY